ncbi:MAG: TfoX/Sxy family protein [Pseudomonadota bacterium]
MAKKPPDPFVAACLARLQPLGPVRVRAMFGGHGFFLDDRMFALIAWERLYFKADGETEARFRSAGGEPFVYEGKGKPMQMGYWWVPVDPDADYDGWLGFAQAGVDAAERAAAKKRKR